MRIVAGEYGSRRLKAVPGQHTRPTTDKIKEGIFNLLRGHYSEGVCLDFYGGSGALAIEAVSRGFSRAVITEKYPPALETIKANIAVTQAPSKFTLLPGHNRSSLLSLKQAEPNLVFDLVLLDPPYHQQSIVEDIEWLSEIAMIDGFTTILCETDNQNQLPHQIGDWQKIKEKNYGLTLIHLYAGKDEER